MGGMGGMPSLQGLMAQIGNGRNGRYAPNGRDAPNGRYARNARHEFGTADAWVWGDECDAQFRCPEHGKAGLKSGVHSLDSSAYKASADSSIIPLSLFS